MLRSAGLGVGRRTESGPQRHFRAPRVGCAHRYPLNISATIDITIPGAGLIEKGLEDLQQGRRSEEALLVSIGAPRLRALGIEVREPLGDPEHELYALLSESRGDGAHSAYNALVRRLVSFERALACAASRRPAVEEFMAAPAGCLFGGLGGAQPWIRHEAGAAAHFDPIAQALAKAERGHEQDRRDVEAMVGAGLVAAAEALAHFGAIEPELYRFPAIDPRSFRAAVEELFGGR